MAGGGPGSLDAATTSIADLARAGLVAYEGPEPVSASEQLDTDYLQGSCAVPSTPAGPPAPAGRTASTAGFPHPPHGIDDQRRYGSAFRALTAFEEGLRKADD